MIFNLKNETVIATPDEEEIYTKNLRRASRRDEKRAKDPHKYPPKKSTKNLIPLFLRGNYPTRESINTIFGPENRIPEQVKAIMGVEEFDIDKLFDK